MEGTGGCRLQNITGAMIGSPDPVFHHLSQAVEIIPLVVVHHDDLFPMQSFKALESRSEYAYENQLCNYLNLERLQNIILPDIDST